ncbi:hypothetical protein [Ciceribacter sp. L1K22]|uniref:hypothetical protein n=1 Tax=Ciceribacter sp. L1K22 TaxID=2820275 RepID=UPI001ABEBA28|nr:hypothetical protein [Ciceribacter sp. L1K22]MBO3760035.1 hypothetical protein [Ciceribacter sp. L1K22]
MEILSIRPSPGGGNVVARFDVQTQFGVRFYNIALKRSPSGWRVFAPSAFGGNVATFSHELAAEMASAAVAAMGGITQNDNIAHQAA